MNKKLIGGLALGVAVAVGLGVHLYNPCKPANRLDKAVAQVDCVEQLKAEVDAEGPEAFNDELCKVAGHEAGCQLIRETDEAAVDHYIGAKVQTCVDAKFKAQNLCVDKSKE